MPVENQIQGCDAYEQARFREVKDIGDQLLKTSATGGFFVDLPQHLLLIPDNLINFNGAH
jgi:hypothetical protein